MRRVWQSIVYLAFSFSFAFSAFAETVKVKKAAPLLVRKGGKSQRIGAAKPGQSFEVIKRSGKWIGIRLPNGKGAWIPANAVATDGAEDSLEEGLEGGGAPAESAKPADAPKSRAQGFHAEPLLSFQSEFGLGFGAGAGFGLPMGEKNALDLGLDIQYFLGKSVSTGTGTSSTSVSVKYLISSLHVRYALDFGGFVLAPGGQVIYAIVTGSNTSGSSLDFGFTVLGGFGVGSGLVTLELRTTLREGTLMFFTGGYRFKF